MSGQQLTEVLNRASQGCRTSQEEVFRLVEQQLRKLATEQMRDERAGHTLQTTVLIDDAFMKLVGDSAQISWDDRHHFYRMAARAMRRILVDHERIRRADKRGGNRRQMHLSESFPLAATDGFVPLLELNEALERLEQSASRQGEVVQMHHFGGYTLDECAKILDVSVSTIKSEWAAARAWLHRELCRE